MFFLSFQIKNRKGQVSSFLKTTRNVICHLVFSICFLVTGWSIEKNITGWNLTFHHHQRHLTLLKFLTCRWIGHKIEGVSCLSNSQDMMHCLYSYLSNKLGFSDFASYLQVEFPSFTFINILQNSPLLVDSMYLWFSLLHPVHVYSLL